MKIRLRFLLASRWILTSCQHSLLRREYLIHWPFCQISVCKENSVGCVSNRNKYLSSMWSEKSYLAMLAPLKLCCWKEWTSKSWMNWVVALLGNSSSLTHPQSSRARIMLARRTLKKSQKRRKINVLLIVVVRLPLAFCMIFFYLSETQQISRKNRRSFLLSYKKCERRTMFYLVGQWK